MKKLLSIVSVLILGVAFAFADGSQSDANSLTAGMSTTQKQEYLNKALSVEKKMVTKSSTSGSTYTSKPGEYGTTGSFTSDTESSTITDWVAYMGPSSISKTEFFRIAHNDEWYKKTLEVENRIKTKHKIGTTQTIVGSLLVLGGAALMAVGQIEENPNETLVVAGAITALVGIVPATFGIINLRYDEKLDISVDFAVGVANVYNKELASQIKLKFN